MSHDVALNYLIVVATLFEPAVGSRILKADLGLDPEGFLHPEVLVERVGLRISELSRGCAVVYLDHLIHIFLQTEGSRQALALLEILSDFVGCKENPRALERQLATFGIPSLSLSQLILTIAELLMKEGHFAIAAEVLESHVGLSPGNDQEDPSHIIAVWWARGGSELESITSTVLVAIIAALLRAERTRKGMAVLASSVGASPSVQGDVRAAGIDLQAELDSQGRESLKGAVVAIIAFLREVEGIDLHREIGCSLLEGCCNVDLLRDPPKEIAHRLKLDPNAAGGTDPFVLLSTFWLFYREQGARLEEMAVALADDVLWGDDIPLTGPFGFYTMVFFEQAIEKVAQDDPERALAGLRRLMPALRNALDFQTFSHQSRKEVIHGHTLLRRLVFEVVHGCAARDPDEVRASALRCELLAWDTELTERLLAERFFLEEIRIPAGSALMPVTGWPLPGELRPASESHLPESGGGSLETAVLSAVEAPSPEIPPEGERLTGVIEPPLHQMMPRLVEAIRSVNRQGIPESRLASAIGRNGLLIRARFLRSGCLLWQAYSSDGVRLTAGPWKVGSVLDRTKLRWMTTLYEVQTALARLSASVSRLAGLKVRRELDQATASFLEGLESGMSGRWQPPDGVQLLSVSWMDRLWSLLEWFPSEPAARELLMSLLTRFRASLHVRESAGLRARLARITRDFLNDVQSIWALDELAAFCTSETDVILQVEDPLHFIPFAHLTLHGEPLYRCVRSVRNSFSLLQGILQSAMDEQLEKEELEEGGLLCVSHFERDDPAWPCAAWLHHGQLHLAQEYSIACQTAAEEPPGTAGVIRAALRSGQSFRALTLCGHGTRTQPGVLLADGLWQGGGADLSRIDWVLMVSCSLGRLESPGIDVDGFCIQLALHRALSVLACRWPVSAMEAVAFANEALRHYLHLQDRARREPGFDGENLRARAVNLARKALLDGEEGAAGRIGLDTSAAFELFGLG